MTETMFEKMAEERALQEAQERAKELGITLQEYLSLKILQKLDDLTVRAYVED